MGSTSMTDRHPRRAFIAHSARLAAGAATLSVFGSGLASAIGSAVASAHEVSGNAARGGELYTAMQDNFYLGDTKGYLYNETSPRARSNPYAYLWPFYEAMAGTIDLYGLMSDATLAKAVEDRLKGLQAYYRGTGIGHDSYPRSPYGNGGDRYYDDNAWVARALIQLYRMDPGTYASALGGAKDVFTFLKTGWDNVRGGMYWVAADWNRDRGTGPTGGFAKVALHLSDLETDLAQKADYRSRGEAAYRWVRDNLLTKTGDQAGKLYWDKILGSNGSIDTRYWSYNQGVMIGAGVLLARLDPVKKDQYLREAEATADAAIAYYNSVGWYSQPVIFNSLFFRNLLLLYAAGSTYGRFLKPAQDFADGVWNNTKIHNKQKHLIKFEEWTGAYKLREQAAMVQLFGCLAWVDAKKDLTKLA